MAAVRHLVQGHPRSLIDLDANRKPIFNFILVINSNFGTVMGRASYRFRDIDA